HDELSTRAALLRLLHDDDAVLQIDIRSASAVQLAGRPDAEAEAVPEQVPHELVLVAALRAELCLQQLVDLLGARDPSRQNRHPLTRSRASVDRKCTRDRRANGPGE